MNKLVVASPWPGELAKGPHPPPPLFSQCEAHGPPIGVGREKNYVFFYVILKYHVTNGQQRLMLKYITRYTWNEYIVLVLVLKL